MPSSENRRHGDPFPLPGSIFGRGALSCCGVDVETTRAKLRDPRLAETFRSLNCLESGGSEGQGPLPAIDVHQLPDSQRSIAARIIRQLDYFGDDELGGADRGCLRKEKS